MNLEDEDTSRILASFSKLIGSLNEKIIEDDEFDNLEIKSKFMISFNTTLSKDIENSEILREIFQLLNKKKDEENYNEDDVELIKSIINFMKQTNLFYKDVLKKLKGE